MPVTTGKELIDRLEYLINTLEDGVKKNFADKIGIEPRSVQRWIKEGRGKPVFKYIAKICEVYPTVSETWLRGGVGDMLVSERPNPIRSIVNKHDLLIGDTLWEFFNEIGTTSEEVMKCCRFDKTFNQVMESSRYPTLSELESLYNFFGLNPILLFQKRPNGGTQIPFTVLERIESVTDLNSELGAYYFADVMEIEKDEWRSWNKKYKKYVKERFDFLKKYGTLESFWDGDDEIEAPSEPWMPPQWIEKVEEKYGIPKGYLDGRALKFDRLKLNSSEAQLQKELDELKEKCKLQEKLIAMYEERDKGEAAQYQAV